MFKRLGFGLLALLPLLALGYFNFNPAADVSFNTPVFHFYIVTFTTFSAAVIAVLLSSALVESAEQRHILAATAFAFIGGMFFSHGFATPGALTAENHPAVRWSAWLTLFTGGFIFAIASLNYKRIPVRLTVNFFIGGLLIYWAIAAFAPELLERIEKDVAPWHRESIFYTTLTFWIFATIRFGLIYRERPNRVDLTMAMVSFWMITASISMHRYPVWTLSWWLYHVIMLVGFLITVAVLSFEYERVRQFNLFRYYVALSLISTALLALAASALFTQFSFNNALAQTKLTANSTAQSLASSIASEFPKVSNAESFTKVTLLEWDTAISKRIKGMPTTETAILDLNGTVLFGNQENWIGAKTTDKPKLEQALAGHTLSDVYYPETPPIIYNAISLFNPPTPTPAGSKPTPSPTKVPDDYVEPKKPRPTASAATAVSDTVTASLVPVSIKPKQPLPDTYVVETYTPLRTNGDPQGKPLGVLVTYQTIYELEDVGLNTRAVGLITAGASMGLLFAALLFIVQRADQLITIRTNELQGAYNDLRQAESMRDDLTYMIVHDLRNPLNAISGTIDLMGHPNVSSKVEMRTKLLGNAQIASTRMTNLIDDLLAVGKIESGEMKLDLQTTTLWPISNEILKAFQSQVYTENQTITLTCAPELTARLDAKLIQRVIENLMSNALKYTGTKVELIITAQPERILFTVRDDGEGVPDIHKKTIFSKYQQAPNANEKPIRKGTGLGLTFCLLVVELHGGQIWVSDAPERGSDFNFWLPQ